MKLSENQIKFINSSYLKSLQEKEKYLKRIGYDENPVYKDIDNFRSFVKWKIVHDGLGELVDDLIMDNLLRLIRAVENDLGIKNNKLVFVDEVQFEIEKDGLIECLNILNQVLMME